MMHKTDSTTNVKHRVCLVKALLIGCLLVLSLSPVVQAAEPPWPPVCQESSLGGQEILICVPPSPIGWNGKLVVYAHGYVAPQAPIALPAQELGRFPGLISLLVLGQRYAFATTSYSKNGYAVEQAGNDLNALVGYFNTQVAPAEKVFVVGASEGGLITTMLVEQRPDVYDGGLAMCGPINGMPDQIDYLADFRVVFDAFFPQVFRFGAADVPSGAFLSWESKYLPAIAKVLQLHPNKTHELFDMTGAAFVPGEPVSYFTTAAGALFYSIWGTNDLIATADGMPYDNQGTWYEGSHNDVALNARVERVEGSVPARGYIEDYYQTAGVLSRPLVTLHNNLDPVVPSWHEDLYAVRVAPGPLFQRIPVAQQYGHCDFSADEILTAFGTLVVLAGP